MMVVPSSEPARVMNDFPRGIFTLSLQGEYIKEQPVVFAVIDSCYNPAVPSPFFPFSVFVALGRYSN